MRRGPFIAALFVFSYLFGVVPALLSFALAGAEPGDRAPDPRPEVAPSEAERVSEIPLADILTNTGYVEDIAVDGGVAWVATRGGLERYELHTGRRERLYTTADGLAEIHVRGVSALAGQVEVRTRRARCRLAGERFACARAEAAPAPEPVLAPRFQDARVSARAEIVGGALVGTAGRGLWLVRDGAPEAPVRLTPRGQVCSNHMMAMAEFGGRLYLGSFDQGLCVTDGRGFRRVEAPFRMVNDLVATPHGLYVAANAGLYHSADGAHFERIAFVTERGVNGLAFDGTTLYATSPGTLWRLPLERRDAGGRRLRRRQDWVPGGARALQKVAVGAGAVWMATEDRGVVRFQDDAFALFDRASGMPTSWVMDVSVIEPPAGAAGAPATLYAATFRHGLWAVTLDDAGQPLLDSARPVAGMPDTWLLRAEAVGDALWVGTQEGAARVEAGAVTGVVRAVPNPCVHAVARFGGHIWLGTEGGLARVAE